MRGKGVNFRIKGHDESGQAFNKFNGNLKRAQQQMRAQVPIQRSWNAGLNANRRAVQQFGFQLSDFAIQIAGGQSAMLAFTQQGGQMLQFFGPAGAIAAAFLAVFGSLGIAIARSGVGLAEITPIMGVLREEFVLLGSALGTAKELLIDFANLVVNNLDVILITASLVAGFFAARWVAAFVAASGAVAALRGMLLASVIAIRTFGVVAGTAQIATFALAGALRAVRVALLRLGIPALVIAMGYLIERFLALVQGAGSVGKAVRLLWDVFKAMISNMAAKFAIFLNDFAIGAANMRIWFGKALIPIAEQWDELILFMVAKWNAVFGNLGDGALKITIGFSAADELRKGIAGAEATVGALTKANAELQAQIDGNQGAFERFSEAIKENSVDIRDWFDGASDGNGGGGGVKKLSEETKKLKETWTGLRDTIAGSFQTAFQGILSGTKSVKDAALEMLGTVLSKVLEIMMQPLFTKWATGIANFIAPALGLPSFDGGTKRTFYGPRSGGVDGRGGRLSIVHPNEEIRDNTRPWQRERGGGQGDVHVHQHNNFALGVADTVRAEVMNMMPEMAEVTAQVVREKVERGGDYGAAFG